MSNQPTNAPSRRRFFRFRYPIVARPELCVAEGKFAITELSEGGLRFLLKTRADFKPNDEVDGQVRFHDGSTDSIAGVILRFIEGEAVVTLTEGITLARVISEQRYLTGKYPGFGARTE